MNRKNIFIDRAVLDNFYTESLPRGCSSAIARKSYYAGRLDSHFGSTRNRRLITSIKSVMSYLNTLQYFEKEF